MKKGFMECPFCKNEIKEGAIKCQYCGEFLEKKAKKDRRLESTEVSHKDRVTAGVFAILLGCFGAHKFYLGKIGLGILYLLFFWTCIPSIISLIEGILYLTSSDKEFQEKYVNEN